MHKILLAAGLGGALWIAALAPVHAESFDMKDMSCAQLMQADEEDAGVILLWLDGYLSGVTGDTRLDTDFLETFAEEMASACEKTPQAKILDVAQIVGTE